jgi:PX domain-containing protein kinase-like protein
MFLGKAQSVDSSGASKAPHVPAPPPIAPPTPAPTTNGAAPPTKGRGALLSSITTFKKNNLKAAQTNDRSGPKV